LSRVSEKGKIAPKGIVIICNLDTRGKEILFVKDLIAGRGHRPILVDFSMEALPPVAGDVTCVEAIGTTNIVAPVDASGEHYIRDDPVTFLR